MRDITEALSWHHEPISNDTQDEEKVDTGHHYSERHAYSMASVETILPSSMACILCISLYRFCKHCRNCPYADKIWKITWVFWQTCTLIDPVTCICVNSLSVLTLPGQTPAPMIPLPPSSCAWYCMYMCSHTSTQVHTCTKHVGVSTTHSHRMRISSKLPILKIRVSEPPTSNRSKKFSAVNSEG